MVLRIIGLAAAALAVSAGAASAQLRTNATADTLAACRATLIAATYDSDKPRLTDWRLAEHVDEASYDALKQAAGPDVAIYGVPAGLDYASFREGLAQLEQPDETAITSREFLNVAWTALDGLPDGPYQTCLEAAAHLDGAGGIILAPTAATQADVTLTVRYRPAEGGPAVLPVEWVGVEESSRPPPPALTVGDQAVVLPRPTIEKTVSVVGGGFTATIILTPLPEPQHAEPSRCAITATPAPAPRLGPAGLATWVCPDIMPAGTYRAAVAIAPRAEGTAPMRVAYRVALLVPVGGTTFAVDLPTPDDGVVLLDAAGGGVFRSDGAVISIPRGAVSFALQVTDVEGDAMVQLPAEVQLTLERVGD